MGLKWESWKLINSERKGVYVFMRKRQTEEGDMDRDGGDICKAETEWRVAWGEGEMVNRILARGNNMNKKKRALEKCDLGSRLVKALLPKIHG